jgi:uncharacterized cupin superfamily protein
VPYQAINLRQKFGLIGEYRRPKVTDETFIVIEGDLRIDFRDGAVRVAPGEMFVVARGRRTDGAQRCLDLTRR